MAYTPEEIAAANAAFLAARAPKPPPQNGGLVRDIKRGTGQIVGSVGSAVQDVGLESAGQGMEQWGDKVVAANPSEIRQGSDMLAHPVTTAREAIGEIIPQLPLVAGGAWAGATGGAAIGSLAGPVGAAVGGAVGGIAGAFTPSLLQEYGGIRKTQKEEGTGDKGRALAAAVPAAALDVVPGLGVEGRLLQKFGKQAVSKVAKETDMELAKKGLVTFTAKKGVQTAGGEMAQEVAQTALERAGAAQELFSPEAFNDYAISGVKGGIGGGVVGAAIASHDYMQARKDALPGPADSNEDIAARVDAMQAGHDGKPAAPPAPVQADMFAGTEHAPQAGPIQPPPTEPPAGGAGTAIDRDTYLNLRKQGATHEQALEAAAKPVQTQLDMSPHENAVGAALNSAEGVSYLLEQKKAELARLKQGNGKLPGAPKGNLEANRQALHEDIQFLTQRLMRLQQAEKDKGNNPSSGILDEGRKIHSQEINQGTTMLGGAPHLMPTQQEDMFGATATERVSTPEEQAAPDTQEVSPQLELGAPVEMAARKPYTAAKAGPIPKIVAQQQAQGKKHLADLLAQHRALTKEAQELGLPDELIPAPIGEIQQDRSMPLSGKVLLARKHVAKLKSAVKARHDQVAADRRMDLFARRTTDLMNKITPPTKGESNVQHTAPVPQEVKQGPSQARGQEAVPAKSRGQADAVPTQEEVTAKQAPMTKQSLEKARRTAEQDKKHIGVPISEQSEKNWHKAYVAAEKDWNEEHRPGTDLPEFNKLSDFHQEEWVNEHYTQNQNSENGPSIGRHSVAKAIGRRHDAGWRNAHGDFGKQEDEDQELESRNRNGITKPSTKSQVFMAIADLLPNFKTQKKVLYYGTASEVDPQHAHMFADPTTAAVYVPRSDKGGGFVIMVADRIQQGNERAVLLHELGVHAGLPKVALNRLSNAVRDWASNKSSGVVAQAWAERAIQTVERLQTERRNAGKPLMSDEVQRHEEVAYFVQYLTESKENGGAGLTNSMPTDVKSWLADLLQQFKTMLAKALNMQVNLTAQDVVDLAHAAAAKVAQDSMLANDTTSFGGESFAATTKTDGFAKWFKDSKVVNENGDPLVVYHGTTQPDGKGINTFKVSPDGALGSGIYTTPDSDFAGTYAGTDNLARAFREGKDSMHEVSGQHIIPLYVSMQKPLVLQRSSGQDPMVSALMQLGVAEDRASKMVEKAYEENGYIGKQVMSRARAQGYDGIMQYRDGKVIEVVAFSPNQIKSAIGNNGEYRTDDNNILYSKNVQAVGREDPKTPIGAVMTNVGKQVADFNTPSSVRKPMLAWMTKHHIKETYGKLKQKWTESLSALSDLMDKQDGRMNALRVDSGRVDALFEEYENHANNPLEFYKFMRESSENRMDPRLKLNANQTAGGPILAPLDSQMMNVDGKNMTYKQVMEKYKADKAAVDAKSGKPEHTYAQEVKDVKALASHLHAVQKAHEGVEAHYASLSKAKNPTVNHDMQLDYLNVYKKMAGEWERFGRVLSKDGKSRRLAHELYDKAERRLKELGTMEMEGAVNTWYEMLYSPDAVDADGKKVPKAEFFKDKLAQLKAGLIGDEEGKKFGGDIATSFARMYQGPYFHNARWGNYFISFKDEDGDPVREHYDSESEHKARVAELTAERKAGSISDLRAGKISEEKSTSAVSRKQLDAMFERVKVRIEGEKDMTDADKKTLFASIKGQLTRAYADMLPETSARTMRLKRRNVRGASDEMRRAFSKRAEAAHTHISLAEYMPQISQAMRDLEVDVKNLEGGVDGDVERDVNLKQQVMARDVTDEMKKRLKNLAEQPDTPLLDTLSGFNHTMYLAANPAYILSNLLQPLQFVGIIGGKHGMVDSLRMLVKQAPLAFEILKEAGKTDFFNPHLSFDDHIREAEKKGSHKGLSLDEWRMLDQLNKLGKLDVTLAREMGAMSQAATSSKIINKTSELARKAGVFGHYSEAQNRISTALASYKLAIGKSKMSHDDAVKYATSMVDETQLNYAGVNRSRMMGKHGLFGDKSPLLFAFKSFQMQVLETHIRLFNKAFKSGNAADAAEGKRQLAGMLGMTSILAGTMGLPLATVVAAVANGLGDDDEDIRNKYRRWAADALGPEMGGMLTNGLFRVTGADIQGNIGQQDLVPFSRFLADRREFKDKVQGIVNDSSGAFVGLTERMIAGVAQVMDGNIMEGMQGMMPKAVASVMKGAKLLEEGEYRDSRGNPLPMKASEWDTFLTAGGFQPKDIKDRNDANRFYRSEKYLEGKEVAKIHKDYYEARHTGDMAGAQVARQALRAYNVEHPDSKIKVQSLESGWRAHKKELHVAEKSGTGILASPKAKDLGDYAWGVK